ncbi:MAG TPA: hypothetical protein VME70_13265 [Mycobacteriales bacterium]|nr:hypothetical protein [Mycobacteriales bacterium]
MIGDRARRRLTASAAGLTIGIASAVLQLAPVLGRGYVLNRDMVFVPRPPLDAHALGLDGLPRDVPSDLLVALASHVLPGDVVQDLVLLLIIAGAGWGAARLAARVLAAQPRRAVLAGAAAAATLYSWNPYLGERLRQGQWAVLIGYAALPWIAATAIALRDGEPRAGCRFFLAVAVAATGGASAELLALPVVLPLAFRPGGSAGWPRRTCMVAAAFVLLSLPWAVPALTFSAGYPSDRVGVLAFAARADTSFGTAGSLLALGGMWNAEVALPGHGAFVVAAAAIVLTVVSLWALAACRRDAVARWLLVAAGISYLLAIWAAIPGVRRLAVDVGSSPAGGLLRDGQRWLAPFVLVVAIGFGVAVARATDRVRCAPALALVPLLLLPAAAWGSDGALSAVHWPGDWPAVRAASSRLPSGPVLVLPWSSQRQYGWNGGRTLAEPAAYWLPRRVVADDALAVGSVSTPLEDPLARRIAGAVAGRGPLLAVLRRQGYAGVLLETDQTGSAGAAARLQGLRPVLRTGTLALYAVPGPVAVSEPRSPRAPTLAGDIAAALAVLICAAGVAEITTRPRRSV